MKLCLFLFKIKFKLSAETFHSECDPFGDDVYNAQLTGLCIYNDVEVTLKAVFKGSGLEELLHKLIGVNALTKVKSKLKTFLVGFISEINYLFKSTFLYHCRNLIDYLLNGCGVGYLVNVDAICIGVVVVS